MEAAGCDEVIHIKTNLVEAHCYSIGSAGQLLSNHVPVETD